MAGEEAALNLLGGLLALPYSIPQAQQAGQQQAAVRDALTKSGGQFTPEVTQALTQAMLQPPAPALGHNIPVVGQLSAGIGTVGRVIQSLAGGGAPAPRPNDFLAQMQGISKLQSSQRIKDMIQTWKNPMARALAENGDVKGGWKLENPSVSRRDIDEWRQIPGNENKPITAFWDDRRRHTHPGGGEGGPKEATSDVKLYQENPALWRQMMQEKGMLGTPGLEKDLEEFTDPNTSPERKKQIQEKMELRAKETGMKAGATAEAKEKYAHLPPAAQKTLGQVDSVRGVINEVRKVFDDPEVKANRGLVAGRIANVLYLQGVSTSPDEDAYVSWTNFLNILGAQPFAQNTRNMQWIAQIQQHLPKPQDDDRMVERKLGIIDHYLDLMEDGIKKAARERLYPNAAPPPSGASPPSSGGGAPAPTPELDDLNQLLEQHGH